MIVHTSVKVGIAGFLKNPLGLRIQRVFYCADAITRMIKERMINSWWLLLPPLEISPGYSRCAGPGEKYRKESN